MRSPDHSRCEMDTRGSRSTRDGGRALCVRSWLRSRDEQNEPRSRFVSPNHAAHLPGPLLPAEFGTDFRNKIVFFQHSSRSARFSLFCFAAGLWPGLLLRITAFSRSADAFVSVLTFSGRASNFWTAFSSGFSGSFYKAFSIWQY